MPRLRYKHVFAGSDDLIAAWRDGTIHEYGKTPANRLNCDETTLYSYGKHFVASRKLYYPNFGDFFLITERKYSNTTSKQLHTVSQILPRNRTLYLPQLDDMGEYGDLSSIDQLADLVCERNSLKVCRHFRFLLRKRVFNQYLRMYGIPRDFETAEARCKLFGRVLTPEAYAIYEEVKQLAEERTARNAELAKLRAIKERMLAG